MLKKFIYFLFRKEVNFENENPQIYWNSEGIMIVIRAHMIVPLFLLCDKYWEFRSTQRSDQNFKIPDSF